MTPKEPRILIELTLTMTLDEQGRIGTLLTQEGPAFKSRMMVGMAATGIATLCHAIQEVTIGNTGRIINTDIRFNEPGSN